MFKKFMIGFLILFASNAFALGGAVGNLPTLTVAGRVFTDTTNIIELHGYVSGATNRYSGFRIGSASAGYTPSGSKAFRVLAIRTINVNAIAAGSHLVFEACTNDITPPASTTPTGTVTFGSVSNLQDFFFSNTAIGIVSEWTTDFTVANGKFLCVDVGANASSILIQVWGYEK